MSVMRTFESSCTRVWLRSEPCEGLGVLAKHGTRSRAVWPQAFSGALLWYAFP